MSPSLSSHASGHVRGASAYSAPASLPYRVFALILDLGLEGCLFFALFMASKKVPMPGIWLVSLFIIFLFATWASQKLFMGATLGERVWNLKSQSRFSLNPPLVQPQPVSPATQSVGIFLTLSSLIATLTIAYGAIVLHPIGMRAKAWDWEAFFPGADAASEKDHWNVMPFYYSLGAWPQAFNGKPIFLNLPYEKGPPERFAGEISSRWDTQIKMTYEGPKSPLSSSKDLYDRGEIQRCTLSLWGSLSGLPHCLTVRSDVLGRHIDALRKLHPSDWSLAWVSVSNRAISPDQQLQGIYLSAKNDRRGQDRFIMITAKGTHQAFILDYPNNESGLAAQDNFKNALKSIRVSDDLNPGRVWVDQSLEKINLRDVSKLGESGEYSGAVQKIAEIQALLIARISVDPKTYDTYFHLAGTAMMLGRAAVKLRQLPQAQGGNPILAADLLTIAKPMVATAQHYAQDVDPKEPRNKLLQAFWAESQKF